MPTFFDKHWSSSPQIRRIFLICAGSVLLVAVLMGAYTLYKPTRAQQLAAQALQALQQGDLAQARQKVMAANELSGRSLPVARAMARVWGALAPGNVVPLWERASELSKGAKEDRQGLALALLAAGEIDRARGVLGELLEKWPNDPQTIFVQANWLLSAMRPGEALEKIEQLAARYPSNEDYLKAYSALVRGQGAPALARYQQHLKNLAGQPNDLGLWAAQERVRVALPQQLDGAIKDLLSHPRATRASALFALQMRHLKAGLPLMQVRREAGKFFNVALAEDRRELARFYRTLGDNDGVLELISPRMAATNREDLMVYLDALAGAQRWQPLLEILAIEKLPLEETWRQIFRARAYAALKRTADSQVAWRKALAAAGNDGKKLAEIAQYLVALGANDEIHELMPRLIENSSPSERSVYYPLWLRVALEARQTARVQEILQKMSAEFPQNQAARNDYIYYSLLLGKPGDWLTQAYQLAKESPSVVAHRMTLALALYRAGQTTRAYEVVSTTRISNWSLMPAGWQYLRAAVFKAAGQPVPEVSNQQSALPEEQALLK